MLEKKRIIFIWYIIFRILLSILQYLCYDFCDDQIINNNNMNHNNKNNKER